MPLSSPITKPDPWNLSRGEVASEWQPFFDKLIRAYPFWTQGSTTIEDIIGNADGIATQNVWINGPYGPALDFAGVQAEVQTPGLDPPNRGMVIYLAKFDSGNGATPVHGTLDFESRVSGGNKLLHQYFNRTLTGTTYDVSYGSYTLAGFGWDTSTGQGPLYKDGVLLQTKTGHTADPGIINNIYIGSSGGSKYLDGVMEMVLILSDWPTQTEWDMLAADPFGWARQDVTSGPPPITASTNINTFVDVNVNPRILRSAKIDTSGSSEVGISSQINKSASMNISTSTDIRVITSLDVPLMNAIYVENDQLYIEPDQLFWVDVDESNRLLIDPSLSGEASYDSNGSLFIDDSIGPVSMSFFSSGHSIPDNNMVINRSASLDINDISRVGIRTYTKRGSSQIEVRGNSHLDISTSRKRRVSSSIRGEGFLTGEISRLRSMDGIVKGRSISHFDINALKSMLHSSHGHFDVDLMPTVTKKMILGTGSRSNVVLDNHIDRPQTIKMFMDIYINSNSSFIANRKIPCMIQSSGKSQTEIKFDASEEWMYDSFFI